MKMCSTIVKLTYYQMFLQLSAIPNLCPQPKSSLINRLINDHLLDA